MLITEQIKSESLRIMHLLHLAYQKSTFIDNAEDLDIVILMYNLLEYSDDFSVTSGSL